MPDHSGPAAYAPPSIRAAFSPSTWDAESRTVEVVFTTGAEVARTDWQTGRSYIEVLEVSESAVDLSRLNAGAPLLNTHSSWTLADIVGVVDRAWIDGQEGRARVRFSERPEIRPIVDDVLAGVIRNISVGYWTDQREVTPATADRPEIRRATRWTPGEISLVPVPADPGAQVRAATSSTQSAEVIRPETEIMPEANTETEQRADPVDPQALITAERTRATDIMTVARQAGLDTDWAVRLIGDGVSIDNARAQALEAVSGRATSRVPAQVAGARQDEGDTQRRLLANALEHRAGVSGVALEDGARQFRGFRMLDYARMAIEMSGGSHRGMTSFETFREAMRLGSIGRMQVRAGAHTTGDFPDLLANTASKMLRASYTSAPRTFTPWCRQVNLPDFKSFSAVALSGAPGLDAIEEDGEVTYGTIGDHAESWFLVRYGKALAITYKALVNDDMSGFTRVPAMWGAAAARKESDVVYGILTANAAMSDGVALFHADHANTTTGALTSVDTTGLPNFGSAVRKLRLQTAPNGEILNLPARYLIVPVALEIAAMQLFSATVVPSTTSAANPYRGRIEVVPEGRLDATSSVQYYVASDPDLIDTIHYGYLEGESAPVISSDVEFSTDGMSTKVMHNFGAKAIDHRGLVYSSGA